MVPKHRKLITLSTVALGIICLAYLRTLSLTPEEFAINLALPAAYTLTLRTRFPGTSLNETVMARATKLKERIDTDWNIKTILSSRDKSECDKVQARYTIHNC